MTKSDDCGESGCEELDFDRILFSYIWPILANVA